MEIKYKLSSVDYDSDDIKEDLNKKKKKGWICLSVFNSPDQLINIRPRVNILYYKWVNEKEKS